MTYPEAEAVLLALPRFADAGSAAYHPGLDRIERVLAAMGNPHRAYPTVHVAGTNGKGSTASMVAALLHAHGFTTGLHTSPHLWHLSERMRVDGVPAPESWIAEAMARYADVLREVQVSFFEATVALSLLYFAEQQVDAAVVEVGLGGRLDATNVVEPVASVVTSIALDHTDVLGDTLAAIAREKAGIFRPHTPAFTAVEVPEALEALHAVAHARGTPLEEVRASVTVEGDGAGCAITTPLASYARLHLDLGGAHQRWNAALALRAAETFTRAALDPDRVRAALADVRGLAGLRGRLDTLHTSPYVIADVAHNPAGLDAALRYARAVGRGRFHILIGLMRDKDARGIAQVLSRYDVSALAVSLASDRALPAHALASTLREAGIAARQAISVPAAVDDFLQTAAPDDVLLVCGSHQVVAALPPSFFAETRSKALR